jgi:cytochrome c
MRGCELSPSIGIQGLAGQLLFICVADAVANQGADLYKEKICHTCHGEDGTHPITQDYPVIAGQPVKYLVQQMRDIRDGRRNNGLSAAMRVSVSNMTDEEFEVIAEWLASRW